MTGQQKRSAENCTVFGKETVILSLAALAGDASSRRYYRAKLAGPISSSVIIMELPSGSVLPLSSEELAIFKKPLKELPFLNVHRFLTRIGVKCRDSTTNRWTKGFYFGRPGRSSSMGQSARSAAVGSLGVVPKPSTSYSCCRSEEPKARRILHHLSTALRFSPVHVEFDHFLEFGLENGREQTSIKLQRKSWEVFVEIAQRLDSLFLLEPPRLS